jgi:hypothetical protein
MPNQIAFYPQSSSGGGAMQLIASTTVASPQFGVTFSAIPQTFKNLKIVGAFQDNGSTSNLTVQFNGDTAAHYSYSYIFNAAPTATAAQVGAQTSSIVAIGLVGSLVLDIPSYVANALGVTYFSSQSSNSGSSVMATCAGSWSNTGITSITVVDSSGAQFAAGTTFTLYGY